jgi:hypothetical protein
MAITIFQCLVCEVGPPCKPIFRVTVRRGGAPAPNIATLEAEAHAGNPRFRCIASEYLARKSRYRRDAAPGRRTDCSSAIREGLTSRGVCGLIELMLRFFKKRSVTGVASAGI